MDTLIAKGERSDDLRLARPGKSATQTPLATPSLARAGSGGSPKKNIFRNNPKITEAVTSRKVTLESCATTLCYTCIYFYTNLETY